MKKILIFSVMIIAGIIYGAGFDINIGDSIEKVYAVMGEPDGYMLVGDRAVVSYLRGKIELVSNKVTRVELISAKKAEDLKRRRVAEKKRIYEYLKQQGETIKQQKLENTEFLSLPLSEQIAFWKNFKKRYTMVNLSPVNIADMAAKDAEEKRKQRKEAEEKYNDELLKMRWKLMEAEERAHKAEMEADRRCRYSYGYTSYLWPPQVIMPGHTPVCRPHVPVCNPVCKPAFGIENSSSALSMGCGNISYGRNTGNITVAPHASRWPSYTPGVFPNDIK